MLMRLLQCRFILHKTIYHIFIFYNTTLSCDKKNRCAVVYFFLLIFDIFNKCKGEVFGGIFRSPVGPRSFNFLKIDL